MASGVPGVSTDVGGVKDVIDRRRRRRARRAVRRRRRAGRARRCALGRSRAATAMGARARAHVLERYEHRSPGRRHRRALSTSCWRALALSFDADAAAPPARLIVRWSRSRTRRSSSSISGPTGRSRGPIRAATSSSAPRWPEAGKFTRYPDSPVFVPEVIRTPGYPAFVARGLPAVRRRQRMAVAIAQAFVFAAICLLVYRDCAARRRRAHRAARRAA